MLINLLVFPICQIALAHPALCGVGLSVGGGGGAVGSGLSVGVGNGGDAFRATIGKCISDSVGVGSGEIERSACANDELSAMYTIPTNKTI